LLNRRAEAAIVVALLMMSSTAVAQHGASVVVNGLLYEIETSASIYWMYEPVAMSLSVTNVTEGTIHLRLVCRASEGWVWHPLSLSIRPSGGPAVWWYPDACYFMTLNDSLAPGASYNQEIVWDMTHLSGGQHITQAGTYTVKGGLLLDNQPEYGYKIELDIDILDPASGVLPDLHPSWGRIKSLYR